MSISSRSGHRRIWTALAWVAAGFALAAAVAWIPRTAEVLATDVLHTVGLLIVMAWTIGLLLAAPLRVAVVGESRARIAVHGLVLGACVYLGYFLLVDADIYARHDRLWAAVAVVAVVISLMRFGGAQLGVRLLVAHGLSRDATGRRPLDVLRAFATGVRQARGALDELPSPRARPLRQIPSRLREFARRLFAARQRDNKEGSTHVAEFIGRIHGLTRGTHPGRSTAVTRAFEQATDAATRRLRAALTREGTHGTDRLALLATRVVELATAELRLEALYRELDSAASTPPHRWAMRSTAALELATIAGRRGLPMDVTPLERAYLACLSATAVEGGRPHVEVVAAGVLGERPVSAEDAVDGWLRLGQARSLPEASFLRVALAGRLLRERYLNWALAVARDRPQSDDAEAFAAACTMEHEAQTELLRAGQGLIDDRDRRTRLMCAAIAAEESDHPARTVSAVLPWEREPRYGTETVGRRGFGPVDTGAGGGVVTVVVLCLVSLVVGAWVHNSPLGNRLKPLRDIHRDENYAATPIADAAGSPAGDRLFLATMGAALQVVDTRTFRIRSERGQPPAGPGYDRIPQIAVGPRGEVLAATEALGSTSPGAAPLGVAARGPDGLWTTIVGAEGVPWFAMDRVRHATATSRHLLFFLESDMPARRLVAYDVAARSLRPCIPASASAPLPSDVFAIDAVPDGTSVIVLSGRAHEAALSRVLLNAAGAEYSMSQLTALPSEVPPTEVAAILAGTDDQIWIRTTRDALLQWAPRSGWRVEVEGDTALDLQRVQHVVAGGAPSAGVLFFVWADDRGSVTDIRARPVGDRSSPLTGPEHRWQRWAPSDEPAAPPGMSATTMAGRSDPRPVAALIGDRPVLFMGTRGSGADGFVAWGMSPTADAVTPVRVKASWVRLPDGMRLLHYDGTADEVLAVVQRARVREVWRWKWDRVLAGNFEGGECLRRTILPTPEETDSFRESDVLAVGSMPVARTLVVLRDGRFLTYDGGLCGVVPVGQASGGHVYGRVVVENQPVAVALRSATIRDGSLWCVDLDHRVLEARLDAASLERDGALECRIVSSPSQGPDLNNDPVDCALPADARIALVLRSGVVWSFRPGGASADWSQLKAADGNAVVVQPASATLLAQFERLGPPVAIDANSKLAVLTSGWRLGNALGELPLAGLSPTPSATFALGRDGSIVELTLSGDVIDAIQVLAPPNTLDPLADVSAVVGVGGGLLVGHANGLRFHGLRDFRSAEVEFGEAFASASWRFLRHDAGDEDDRGVWAECTIGPAVRIYPVVGLAAAGAGAVPLRVGEPIQIAQDDSTCVAGERLVVHRAGTGAIDAHDLWGRSEVLRQPIAAATLDSSDALKRTARAGPRLFAVDSSGRLMVVDLADGRVGEVEVGRRNFIDVAVAGDAALALDTRGVITKYSRSASSWTGLPVAGIDALSLIPLGTEVLAITSAGGVVRLSDTGRRPIQELPGFAGARLSDGGGLTAVFAGDGQLLLAGKDGLAVRSDGQTDGLVPVHLPDGVMVSSLRSNDGAIVISDQRDRLWRFDRTRRAVVDIATGLSGASVRGIARTGTTFLALTTDRRRPIWRMPEIGAAASPVAVFSCASDGDEDPHEIRHAAAIGGLGAVLVADDQHVQRIDLDAHTYAPVRIADMANVEELRSIDDWCLATWADQARRRRLSACGVDGTVRTLPGPVLATAITDKAAYALIRPDAQRGEVWMVTSASEPRRVATLPSSAAVAESRPEHIAARDDGSGFLLLESGAVTWLDASTGVTSTLEPRTGWSSIHAAGSRLFARRGEGVFEFDSARIQFGRPLVVASDVVRGDGQDVAVLSRSAVGQQVSVVVGAAVGTGAVPLQSDPGVPPTGSRILQVASDDGDTLYMLLADGAIVAYDVAHAHRRSVPTTGRVQTLAQFGGHPIAFVGDAAGTRAEFLDTKTPPLRFSASPTVDANGRIVGLGVERDGTIVIAQYDLSKGPSGPRNDVSFRPAMKPFAENLRKGDVSVALIPSERGDDAVLKIGSSVVVVRSADDIVESTVEVGGAVADVLVSRTSAWVLESTGAVRVKRLGATGSVRAWPEAGVKKLEPIASEGVLGRRDVDPWQDWIFRPDVEPITLAELTGAKPASDGDRAWRLGERGPLVRCSDKTLQIRPGERPAEPWAEIEGMHATIGAIDSIDRVDDGFVVRCVDPSGDRKFQLRLRSESGSWSAAPEVDPVLTGELVVPDTVQGGWLPLDRIEQVGTGIDGEIVIVAGGGAMWSLRSPWKVFERYAGTLSTGRTPPTFKPCAIDQSIPVGRDKQIDPASGRFRHLFPTRVGLLSDGASVYQDAADVWRQLSGAPVDPTRNPVATGTGSLPSRMLGARFLVDAGDRLRWQPSGAVIGSLSADVALDADRWLDVTPLRSSTDRGAGVIDALGQVWFVVSEPGRRTLTRRYLGAVTGADPTRLSFALSLTTEGGADVLVRDASRNLVAIGADLTLRPIDGDRRGYVADSAERSGALALGDGTALEWRRDPTTHRFAFHLLEAGKGLSVPCRLTGSLASAQADGLVVLTREGKGLVAFDTSLRLPDGRHWVVAAQSPGGGSVDWRRGQWATPVPIADSPRAISRGGVRLDRRQDGRWSSMLRVGDVELDVPYAEGRLVTDVPIGMATLRQAGAATAVVLTRWREGLVTLGSGVAGTRPDGPVTGVVPFPAGFARPAQGISEETSAGLESALVLDARGAWWLVQADRLSRVDHGPRRFTTGRQAMWRWDEVSPRRIDMRCGDTWAPVDLLRASDDTEALDIDVVRRAGARELVWETEPVRSTAGRLQFQSETGRWLSLDSRMPTVDAPPVDLARRWVDAGWWRLERSPRPGDDSSRPIHVAGNSDLGTRWSVRAGRLPFDRIARLDGRPAGPAGASIATVVSRAPVVGPNAGAIGLSAPVASSETPARTGDPAQHRAYGKLQWRGTQVVVALGAGDEVPLGDVRSAEFPLGERARIVPLSSTRAAADARLTFLNSNWRPNEVYGFVPRAGLLTFERIAAGRAMAERPELALDEHGRPRMFVGRDLAWDVDSRAFVGAKRLGQLASSSPRRPQFGLLVDGRTDLARSFRVVTTSASSTRPATLQCIRDFGEGPVVDLFATGNDGVRFDHELPIGLEVNGSGVWLTFENARAADSIENSRALACLGLERGSQSTVRAVFRALGGRISDVRSEGSDLAVETVGSDGVARTHSIAASDLNQSSAPRVVESGPSVRVVGQIGELWRVTASATKGGDRALTLHVRTGDDWRSGRWLVSGEGLPGSAVMHAFAVPGAGALLLSSEGAVPETPSSAGFAAIARSGATAVAGTRVSSDNGSMCPPARRTRDRVVVRTAVGEWREVRWTPEARRVTVSDLETSAEPWLDHEVVDVGPWAVSITRPGTTAVIAAVVPGLGGATRAVACQAGALDFDRCRALFRNGGRPFVVSPLGPLNLATGATDAAFDSEFSGLVRTDAVQALSSPTLDGVFLMARSGPHDRTVVSLPPLPSASGELQRAAAAETERLGVRLASIADGSISAWLEPAELAPEGQPTIVVRRRGMGGGRSSFVVEARGGEVVIGGRLWCDTVLAVLATDTSVLGTSPSPGTYFATLAGVEEVRWDQTSGSPRGSFVAPWMRGTSSGHRPPSTPGAALAAIGPTRRFDSWVRLEVPGRVELAVPKEVTNDEPLELEPQLLMRRLATGAAPNPAHGGLMAGSRLWIATPAGAGWLELAPRWRATPP